ncbi:MAG: hypothetical protein H6710_08075 [Myxococcales bacterium]|nr:hypothetical protein [Myxococcales bacterium]MCB9704208.1 hypothetical protein [Myxococcales bacterium]
MEPTHTQKEIIRTVKRVLSKLRSSKSTPEELALFGQIAHNLLSLDVVRTAIERQIHHEATHPE